MNEPKEFADTSDCATNNGWCELDYDELPRVNYRHEDDDLDTENGNDDEWHPDNSI